MNVKQNCCPMSYMVGCPFMQNYGMKPMMNNMRYGDNFTCPFTTNSNSFMNFDMPYINMKMVDIDEIKE